MEQLLCVCASSSGREWRGDSGDEEPSTFRGSEKGEKRMPSS